MKRVVRLTESDLNRIVKRVLNEQDQRDTGVDELHSLIEEIKELKELLKSKNGISKREEILNKLTEKLNIANDYYKKNKSFIDKNFPQAKELLDYLMKQSSTLNEQSEPQKNDPKEKVKYPGIKQKGGGYLVKPMEWDVHFKEEGGKKLYWLKFKGEPKGNWYTYEDWVNALTDSYLKAYNKGYSKVNNVKNYKS